MKTRFSAKTGKNILAVAVIAVSAVGFASYDGGAVFPENYVVNIKDGRESSFITEPVVLDIIQGIGVQQPGLMRPREGNLKLLEKQLQTTDFIRKAEVARDLKGNLIIDVEQDSPLARIMAASGREGYVAEDGSVLPLSNRYTSRVPVLTGNGADSLFSEGFFEGGPGKEIFALLNYVAANPLWKAQVSQVDLDSKLNLTLYPQIGKQHFQLGQAEGFHTKFEKMKVFYKDIAPNKGWNTYTTIKLQYGNQIVCE